MKRSVPTFTSIEPFIEAYTLYWIGLRFSPSTAIWPRIHPYSYSRPEKIDWKWGKCDLNTGPQIHITKRPQTTRIMHHVCPVPQRTNYIHCFCFFWFNQNHRFLTKKLNPIRLAVWLTGTENRENRTFGSVFGSVLHRVRFSRTSFQNLRQRFEMLACLLLWFSRTSFDLQIAEQDEVK